MALIDAHLNVGVTLVVTMYIYKPSSPTSIPPSPFSPSLISLVVSVGLKHHVYLLFSCQIMKGTQPETMTEVMVLLMAGLLASPT